MLIEKIINFLKTNKKTCFYIAIFAIFFSMSGDLAFANPTNESVSNGDANTAEWFNALVQVIATGIGLLTNIVGLFLSPSWTNATGIGLHIQLKDLWIMMSNIVYVIFAFLLIVIAFMNIIGKADKWELKQALPKFVIGVLIVPFSWMFVQVVIAISSFLSVSVLMLPYDVLSNSPASTWSKISEEPICTNYIVVSKQKSAESGDAVNESGCGGTESVSSLLTSNGVYGLLNIYTFGIFSLDDLGKINGNEVDSLTSIFKIGINGLVILSLALVYFILMVSLCLALFVRGMWLWMYMIFSPVFGLLFFFDKSKEGFDKMDQFSIKEFISLAMVPVYVSAALAFGLLFIFVAGTAFDGNTETTGFVEFQEKFETGYLSATEGSDAAIKKAEEVGSGTRIVILEKFKLDMYGDIGTSGKNADGMFDVLKSGFGTLLMQFFGLAVLWVAVMAAINQSKITGAVVKPIAEFGSQVGGLIQKSPQYAPIFGGQSMTSLKTASGAVSSSMQTKQNTMGNSFAEKHFGSIMGGEKASEYRKLGATTPNDIDKALSNIAALNKAGNTQEIANSQEAIKAYVMNLEKLKGFNGFTNDTEAQKAIDLLKNSNGNANKVDEALTTLDGLGISSNRSILGGETKVKRGSADDYMGTDASSYKAVDKETLTAVPLGNKNGDIQTYSLLGQNIEVNDNTNKVINEEEVYSKLALAIDKLGIAGTMNKVDLHNQIKTSMSIENPEAFIDGLAKYLKKDNDGVIKFHESGDSGLNKNDLFNDTTSD